MENYFQAEAFNLDKVLDEFEQNEGEPPPPPLLPPPPLHWRLYGRRREEMKFWGSCGLDALTQAASKSDNQSLLSEFEQRSQVVIEGVWGGNWTNWTIHLPGASGKLCYQSKTKGGDLFSSLTLAAKSHQGASAAALSSPAQNFIFTAEKLQCVVDLCQMTANEMSFSFPLAAAVKFAAC